MEGNNWKSPPRGVAVWTMESWSPLPGVPTGVDRRGDYSGIEQL